MTAEKFLKQSKSLHDMWDNTRGRGEWDEKAIINSHIEFAKYHVEQALKAASQTKLEANYDNTGIDEERYPNDKSLILNAYPLENIK
jgi:hypothetical protein